MDKYLLQYKGSKQVLALIGLLTVVQSIAIVFQAIYLAKAITQLFQGAEGSIALRSFVIFIVANSIRHLIQWGKERIAYRFADRTAKDYEQQLLRKIFTIGPQAVGKYGSGHLVTLGLEGVPKFRKYLELLLPRSLSMAIVPFVILVYVFTLDKMSAITLLIVLPILIIFLILIGMVSQKKIDDQMDTYRLLSRHFVDSLRGIVTLKYLGHSRAHEQSIATVSNKYRIATNRSLRYAFLSSFSLDFFASLSVAVVAVELGLRLINGQMLLEPSLAILILAPEYFSPVRELGNDFHATADGKDASMQIHAILEEAEPESLVLEKTIRRWNAESSLELKNLEVKMEEQTIFKGLTMKMQGYGKVGVIGHSGAGKSTLIDVLSGFTVPTGGACLLDGQELPHLSTAEWQDQVAYIPQHPTIFPDSVINNIRFYEPDASLEEVTEAAKRVGLDQLITTLPNGYDERIGAGGRSLSGGEEQRIAVARSLLQLRQILLFDEPTAHLDVETEHELKQMLLPLLEDKLVVFATHRIHWMQDMDTIIVLENGKVVETGSHEELIGADGAYCRLLEARGKGHAV
ncbi:cysteine/glutathione ABC superfamily ATP binding cassette transporter, ABC protein [Sporosarcina newyorkensis 2681]|uniref:Cysteine/glutathione ABC superfamily ATP binding cassette transporter, ABC protein n=1 Tax=Sporosarcina newyorkensis 2681 TaxID=1027292 RepID=F9DVW2_9BACL|nr:thiol reductant ABC exporter subunit CydD [Sporosarcina newyorkensis]EGQ22343.1 cysteine/glutathione ABC superfamily ATP binding cassette transporter, ABC protein [Sporosarcina newyorkensis 2681]